MPSYLEIFGIFLRGGALTVGNSYAAVTPIRRRVVTERQLLTPEAFEEALTLAQAMPGVFSVNLSAYLGFRIKGWGGSAAAVAGILLPPLAIMMLLIGTFGNLRENTSFAAFLKGVRPAIVALIVLPCVQLLRSGNYSLSTIWLPVCAAAGIWLLGVSPVYIVVATAIVGVLYALFVRPNE